MTVPSPDHLDAGAPAALSPRRRATRERLIEAALEVFATTSIEAASVEHICEAAGFTRGAFYSNFADKDDLLVALVERRIEQVTAALDCAGPGADGAAPPDAAIGTALEAVLAMPGPDDARHASQAEVRLHLLRSGDARLRGACRRLDDAVAASIVAALARVGLEPSVEAADLVSVLEAVFVESHHRAAVDGHDDAGRLARATVPRIVLALTRPRTT